MSDALPILMNRRRLKAAISGLTISQLEDMQSMFSEVFNDLLADHRAQAQQEAEHKAKIETAIANLEDLGCTLEDLRKFLGMAGEEGAGSQGKVRKPRVTRPVDPSQVQTYRFICPKRGEREWNGRGRVPSVIRDAIDSGDKTLEDFLVK